MKGIKRLFRIVFGSTVLLVMALLLWITLVDHAEVDGSYVFDPTQIPADLDTYLSQSEKGVPNLRPGVQKRIQWAGAVGDRTDWSVVYLHGFSATSEEIRPVPDRIAESLGANLFYTRFAGHGRDGEAMAEPSGADWLADTAEAIEIGRRLGERVLVIGTSTGGTLAKIAAVDLAMAHEIGGIVFVSPNFQIANPMADLLTLPGVRWWGPIVAGETRSFEPSNEGQAKYWTTSYPTLATVTLGHLVAYADRLDPAQTTIPALFMFSDDDEVVVAAKTREVAANWGGAVAYELVAPGPGIDPNAHVIAGDIKSPGQTDRAVEAILEWVSGL